MEKCGEGGEGVPRQDLPGAGLPSLSLKEKLEQHESKLALIIVSLGSEERMNVGFNKVDARIKQLESMLQTLSTLLSQMEALLSHYDQISARRR